jgi:hypothetical protein
MIGHRDSDENVFVLSGRNIKPFQGLSDVAMTTLSCTQGYSG